MVNIMPISELVLFGGSLFMYMVLIFKNAAYRKHLRELDKRSRRIEQRANALNAVEKWLDRRAHDLDKREYELSKKFPNF